MTPSTEPFIALLHRPAAAAAAAAVMRLTCISARALQLYIYLLGFHLIARSPRRV